MTGAVIIRTCGDLSARRPGSGWTRKPVRLPAERQRLGAIPIFKHAGRRFAARDLVGDAGSRVRDRLGIATARGCRTTDHGRPVPISFLGLGRALQPAKQSRGGLTDRFHLPSSLSNASASCVHLAIGAKAWGTEKPSNRSRKS